LYSGLSLGAVSQGQRRTKSQLLANVYVHGTTAGGTAGATGGAKVHSKRASIPAGRINFDTVVERCEESMSPMSTILSNNSSEGGSSVGGSSKRRAELQQAALSRRLTAATAAAGSGGGEMVAGVQRVGSSSVDDAEEWAKV